MKRKNEIKEKTYNIIKELQNEFKTMDSEMIVVILNRIYDIRISKQKVLGILRGESLKKINGKDFGLDDYENQLREDCISRYGKAMRISNNTKDTSELILLAVANNDFKSTREIAKCLNLNERTVRKYLFTLKEKYIIKGNFFYGVTERVVCKKPFRPKWYIINNKTKEICTEEEIIEITKFIKTRGRSPKKYSVLIKRWAEPNNFKSSEQIESLEDIMKYLYLLNNVEVD